jgi:hypothetical protein
MFPSLPDCDRHPQAMTDLGRCAARAIQEHSKNSQLLDFHQSACSQLQLCTQPM